ncbi:hypothetical protein ACFSUJ_31330 [Streptomyces lusitanus]|uniref:Uncharacterized protein n=1 Tax=Streptomyces lusitanus TaxID=68232 RepID=A0ABU3JNC0_9ACTN|nr:hypothetical protein [Streptomyces lusitanus]
MRDDSERGKLQIYAVESAGPEAATCVVRCTGGIARTGQRYSSGEIAPLTLEHITRYGRAVDFVDPPHNAKVRFSGEGARGLVRNVVLVEEEHQPPCGV